MAKQETIPGLLKAELREMGRQRGRHQGQGLRPLAGIHLEGQLREGQVLLPGVGQPGA